jgi:AcrR family transcriptional regulator
MNEQMFNIDLAFSIMTLVHRPAVSPQPRPPTRNERRRAQTRARLLAAARKLFATRGFEQTTIRDVARDADTALGSFYNYFRTKEDVLAALLEEVLEQHLELLEQRQRQADDVAERVSIAHRHLLATVRSDPEWGWLLVRLDVEHRILEHVLAESAMCDLRDGIDTGRFAVTDADVALQASGGALLAVMHAALRGVLPAGYDGAHAEGVLRSFGVAPAQAREIARRPLPEVDAA